MTAAFIEATENLIAMAADTLSWDANNKPIEVKKAFVLAGRIGVISHGCGPTGVPSRIENADIGNDTVEDAAKALAATFRDVTAPYEFGLYVAGFDGDDSKVWHIDVPSNFPPRRDYTGPGRTLAGWVAPPKMHAAVKTLLTDQLGRLDLVDDVVNLVRQCYQLDKELIGLEVDYIVIDSRGARLHKVRPRAVNGNVGVRRHLTLPKDPTDGRECPMVEESKLSDVELNERYNEQRRKFYHA